MKKEMTLESEFKRRSFRVSIFGSARIKRNDPTYKKVHDLAKELGERGIDVVTGGGPGLMGAANAGHRLGSKKTGAHSIGLNIKLPKEQLTNKHLDIKTEYQKFSERLDNFMSLSNVIIVAPGGVGTMLELMYAWQLVQVEHVERIPIILLGEMWEGLKDWLEQEPLKRKFFDKKDFDLLYYTETVEDTMKIIDQAHGLFKNGKEIQRAKHLRIK